jgi:hypothetical protein
MTYKKALDVLLVVLIFLDVLYDIVIFCSPRTWFPIMRGAYIGTEGLLRRTATQIFCATAFYRGASALSLAPNKANR